MRVEWAEVCLGKGRIEKRGKKPSEGIVGVKHTGEGYEMREQNLSPLRGKGKIIVNKRKIQRSHHEHSLIPRF